MNRNKTLVLTGFDKFWPDKEHKAVFLGPWCFTYNKKYDYQDYQSFYVVQSPWRSNLDIYKGSLYINELVNRLMPEISIILNKYFGTDFTESFWTISTMCWVVNWLDLLYDRYMYLEQAGKIFTGDGKLKIKILANPYQFEIEDYGHLSKACYTHEYNLCLFSQIIKAANFDFLSAEEVDISFDKVQLQNNRRQSSNGFFKQFYHLLFPTDVYLDGVSGLTRKDKSQLYLARRRRYSIQGVDKKIFPKNKDFLRNRTLEFESHNKFEQIVKKLFVTNLPAALLREIPALSKSEQVKYWIGHRIWNRQTNAFKIARIVENGGTWISVQHGGGYGQNLFPNLGKIEFATCGNFISWGWEHKYIYDCRVFPLSSPYLSNLKPCPKQSDRIFYVGSLCPAYRHRLYCRSAGKSQMPYIKNKVQFLKNLLPHIRDNLIYKPYANDYGINQKRDLLTILPEAQFVTSSMKNAREYIAECRLFVADHLGTSYLESLAMNVPTVIFWSPEHFAIIDKAKPDFKELEDAGIYHQTPESAAKHINEIYDDVYLWWDSPKVKEIRDTFIYKYARNSPDYLREWIDFVKKLP